MASLLFASPSRAEAISADDHAKLIIVADALFKRMLLRPDDLETAFRYAEIETRLGDEEAAIGALERMLFYNPNLPRVKLELGLLYFRLGSFAMSRSYFESAVASADAPADVRAKVKTFLAEIDRRLQINRFSFFAQTGVRSQSNANVGPNSDIIRVLGQDASLATNFRKRADTNVFGTLNLHHVYDFENQRGDVWETDVSSYYARQFLVHNLNLGLVEATTGPRLGIGEATGISVHPYVLGNDVTLGDREYFGSGGGGVSFLYATPIGVAVEPSAEFRARRFANSSLYSFATQQQGNQVIGAVSLSGGLPVNGLGWQARFSYVNDTAKYQPYAYDQVGLELALPYQFDGLIGERERRWTIAPFASIYSAHYDRPDPIVDPTIRRIDTLYRVGATLDTALWHDFGFALTVEYDATHSKVSNYSTSDFIVSGGPTLRF